MLVLGIETSCDETSVAVVKDGKKVLANQVSSSLNLHKKHGGVIPEIASRMQLETIASVGEAAIIKAGIKLKDIDLVSVTNHPGLLGSLLVGVSFAKSVALSLNCPLLGVDHIHSHFYANFLDAKGVELPFVALVVSGGHTSLFYVKDFDKISILGETQDDACGEAFDKVAKILGLGYPGGPHIEKLARQGDPRKIKFACSGTKGEFDFSFSGIKTAVLYYVNNRRLATGLPRAKSMGEQQLKSDIAASFQETVIDTLIRKSFLACKTTKTNRLVIGGGVVANGRLREKFLASGNTEGINCYFPPVSLCIDNAAMIAGFGYQLFKKGFRSNLSLNALPS
ncbi:MAG: tRNA (adenosine(37)-N6)-threonylcarbamoyltransferase complex transferase subunit TsaD [Candidatus Omnitrophica bacterium]|nr:tRNA (adenosine(37)-N6)-threonylcarbamoyltransferase complex transferase subunit TsaD [Candidatus Omnitrophota bacterium]